MIAIFLAAGAAILVAGVGMPLLVRWLANHGIGQPIRDEGPQAHKKKAGKPTMGGIAIIFGFVVGYLVGHLGTSQPFSRAGVLSVVTVVAAGAVGFADDWVKVKRKRNLGLNKRAKLAALVAVAVGYAMAAALWAHVSTTLSYARYDVPGTEMGTTLWVIWAALIVVGTANAVNLTDGLDGLAAGSSTFTFGALALIAYWEYRHLGIYHIASEIDLALMAVAMTAACAGFLWWNAAPARIFMGDTGSLALGAALATLALDMNLQLLLPVIGGLFVIETVSVVLQVASFRIFHKRIFRMAPIHHHFELAGWPETTVVVRFWLVSGMFTALSLGLFYADFLSVGARK
jgi:phospho-N-acetylmuramoyl-pentapeptide-transferase